MSDQGGKRGSPEKEELAFDIGTCPVKSVVVFLDRAEVCRTIDATVKAGENEVVLKNVTSAADGDSIRVEGQGVATISEVSFQTKHVTAGINTLESPTTGGSEGSQQERARIEAELKQVEERITTLNGEIGRLKTQQNVLEGFGGQLVEFADNEGVLAMGSKASLEGLDRYLELYDKRVSELVDKQLDIKEEIRIAEAKKASLMKNLQERTSQVKVTSTFTKEEREISILLDAEKAGEVHLVVYYVVLNASWSPKYDVRTFVNDRRMQVHYFGVIKQSTNEDWRDAHVSLSTAVPSVGGTPPKISANTLTFQRRSMVYGKSKRKGFAFASNAMPVSRSRATAPARSMGTAPGGYASSSEDDEMTKPVADVQSGAFSTAFDIEKPATIPADNTGHKVQVAILDLRPSFSYETVPKLSARAFLKAKVKNESPYALLAGPSNIFLEGNFVAKSSLPAVSPQEQFECSLGVDPSVRVTYKPVQRFREQGGLVSKTTTSKYRQFIEVKNTQQEKITIKVIDQLPLSTEEKIKVQLLAPELQKPERGKPLPPDAYPRLNSSNNVEWLVHIAPGKSEELLLRYSVEFPSGSRIDGL